MEEIKLEKIERNSNEQTKHGVLVLNHKENDAIGRHSGERRDCQNLVVETYEQFPEEIHEERHFEYQAGE